PRAHASSQPHPVAGPSPAIEALERRVRAHYAQYRDGSSFGFIEQDFAPRVERYLSLTNVSASELSHVARAFYADKSRVLLTPQSGSFQARAEGERLVVSFVLSLQWSKEPPPPAEGCVYLDENMGWQSHPTIDRRVEVSASLTIDGNGRFVRYQ